MSTDALWTPQGNVQDDRRVRVEHGLPPNYVEICSALGEPSPNAVFAWDDRVYVPNGGKLSPDLEVHESVHFAQQSAVGGAEFWWAKYLHQPLFRLEQEVEAYRAQIACFATREERRKARRVFAKTLAGPLYQLPITWQQADAFLSGRSLSMATCIKAAS